ncbi:MarC family protein [Pyrofollis japonicus]|uniref:MarC family protein n=1 Tax=Pyrofollis japonicus TaxID=3060460 RepID=UPI00295BA7B1|nr:MarC family protein [Pyrofollis japonicus]
MDAGRVEMIELAELAKLYASYYITLLFIMNPFGAAPIFADIAEKLSPAERSQLLRYVAFVVLGLLYSLALGGKLLLEIYHVSIMQFRFAGGIILMAIAIYRLTGRPITQTPDPRDAAIVPLAMPILVGPATITYLILFSTTGHLIVLLLVIPAVTFTVWLVMTGADMLLRRLGRNVMVILTRVSALFVGAVGAAMIDEVVRDWIRYSCTCRTNNTI